LHLTIEEATARIADLEHDLVAYREIATQAIHKLHDYNRIITRERQQRLDLAEEFRQFRRRVMADSLLVTNSELRKPSEAHHRQSTVTPPPPSLRAGRSERPRPHA
jgi:hypothetical protein